jgi:hypothetical protein
MRIVIAIAGLCALSSCAPFIASLPGPVKVTAQDAAPASKIIADIIGLRLPPGLGTVRLDPPQDEMGKVIAEKVTEHLKASGCAIDETPHAAHRIGLAFQPLKAGALLTVIINGGLASVLLSRDAAGGLITVSGLSFREVAP